MDTTCKQCQFFIQHYGFRDSKFYPLNCGHCTFARPKRKLPDAKICAHFLPGAIEKDTFVTKEYLTKKLLNHVLSLDLFPESPEHSEIPAKRGTLEENPETKVKSY